MSDLAFIRENIYHLKQEYGENLSLSNVSVVSQDILTGVKTTSSAALTIKRAIRLPNRIAYSFLKAVGNFQGMAAVRGLFQILIDKDDLGSFEVSPDKTLVLLGGQKYVASVIDDFPYAIILTVKGVQGTP